MLSAAWRDRLIPLLLAALAAPVVAQPVPVRVMTPVEARFGESFTLTGTLTAERAARLSPRVDGLVSSIAVDAGDPVRKGDVLLLLDDAMARLALERSRAEQAAARAALDEAERQYREAVSVGQQDFLPATLIATREAEMRGAEARLAAAEAGAREQEEYLARHALIAPFDGFITERLSEAGEWVQRGGTVLVLVATDRIRLDLRVPQERWTALAGEIDVVVRPDAQSELALPARVGARVPVTEPGARTFLLRLLIDDAEHRLLPGMSARAEISLPAERSALGVPRDALLRQPDGGYSLFVVIDEGGAQVARQRTVSVTQDQGDLVPVAAGIAPGERIVVRGNEALRDGQPVRIVMD